MIDRSRGRLVWEVDGRSITVQEDMPFALLQAKRTELKRSPQYQRGKLRIKYMDR